MTDKSAQGDGFLTTPPFRISYPALFKPTSMDGNKPKFQLTMVFPKGADLKAMNAAAVKAAKEKWGSVPDKLKKPFLDGDEEENEQLHGTIFIRATTKYKPGVITASREPVLEADEHLVKAGYWARAIVNAWGWTYGKKKGVSFGIQHVQLLPLSHVVEYYKDNDKVTYDIVEELFAGGPGKAEEAFADDVVASEDDPTEYMSDDDMADESEDTDDFMS